MVEGGSAGAAAWMATWRHLLLGVFADELPDDHLPWGGDRWALTVTTLLEDPDNLWWDDTGTPAIENRDDILARALRDANAELTELLGDNPTRWAWGRLHVARFRNQSFGESGIGPIEWLFNRTAPRRVGGSPGTVNAVGWSAHEGYEVDWIPSFRMVIDLDDLSRSTFVHSTGQSGHAFHHHYDDMIEPWTDGLAAPMIYRHGAIESAARNTLRMMPAG
jgi:penicillin G amidase